MARKKKTWMERLGLEPVRRLNKTLCKKRVTHLRKQIKAGKYRGELLKKAKYYANWYAWMADNGGTRGEDQAA